jgi:hypothetical protein
MRSRKNLSARLLRARKEHTCTERSYHTIKPGDLHLYVAAPPWHDMNSSRKWWVIRACLRCADEFGLHTSDTRAQAEAESVVRS